MSRLAARKETGGNVGILETHFRGIEPMNRYTTCSALVLALLAGAPAIATESQGSQTEHRAMGMAMTDDSMRAMHQNMAKMRADLEKMQAAESDDAKLDMMERQMDGMMRHMEMMMDAMGGKKGRMGKMHDHGEMKMKK